MAEWFDQIPLQLLEESVPKAQRNALARIWKAERFSWWMTNLLHRFPEQTEFDIKMQRADLGFLRENKDAQSVLAQNYAGLPY